VIDSERRAALDAIAGEVAVCTKCRLHEARTRAVPGEGNAATEVMFVGEGPGFNEDRQGRPFVGQAGALLGELLASIGWARDEVFITNVVKCRPPGNRDPEPDEIAACAPYLTRQIAVLEPALIVTLGRFSMARFNPGVRIGQAHGTYREADAAAGAPGAVTFAMYHPAAALHQGSLKETLFRDMAGVPAALSEARRARQDEAGGSPWTPEAEPGPAESPAVEPVAADMRKLSPSAEPAPSVDSSAPEPVHPEAVPGMEPDGAEPASEIVPVSGESDPTDQLTLF
jgi:uracil-DNA glycosylase family 4